MELYIFNRDLEFQGIIDTFTSFRWIRRYHKAGEFELHCLLTQDSLQLLQRENIIYKKGDTEAGYIEYRELKLNESGQEELVVKGKFLTGYLGRRIIWGQEILQTTAEQAMRSLVDKHCINAIADRVIPNLILGDVKNYSENINYQTSYNNLLDELENISNISDLGYRINFDINNRKLIFEVYKGLDRTANQLINPQAIFSRDFENILEQQYVDSIHNFRNVALVGGIGEGIARKLTTIGQAIGLNRFEMFVDARDISDKKQEGETEIQLTEQEYLQMLVERGNTKLTEQTELKTFDSRINLQGNLKYKQDFDLGDIVTVVDKNWNIRVDTRITEIEEIYEVGKQEVNIVFGNNIPTLIDKIKQIVR